VVIAFWLLMLLEFLRKYIQIFQFIDCISISTQKSNQKVSANKSKNHTLAFATANALGSSYIVFLRCLMFSIAKKCKLRLPLHTFTNKHPKKSNSAARVSNFGSGQKRFFDFLFFVQPRDLKPLQDDPDYETRNPCFSKKSCSEIKKIKKESKVKFRVYKKASSSPSGF
jgi:hypothetical protein